MSASLKTSQASQASYGSAHDWVSTPYNDYALKKAQMARDRSSFMTHPETMNMELECLNFIRLYDLQIWLGAPRNYQADPDPKIEIQRIRDLWHQASGEDKKTIVQCVGLIHSKYQIDVTHGLDAVKKQWIAENGGSNDSAERAVLQKLFSSVGCLMLTAMRINGVNQIDTCDDPGSFMTTEFLLSSLLDLMSIETALRQKAAAKKAKLAEPSLAQKQAQAQAQNQQATGARVFSQGPENGKEPTKQNNSAPE